MENDRDRLGQVSLQAIPGELPEITQWGAENVVLPSSARAKYFNASITPWLVEPLQRALDIRTRIVTLMKPVQSGGSTLGEVLMLYWIMYGRGFLQYNWSTDKRAEERWASRIKPILDACKVVADRMRRVSIRGEEIDFGNVFFRTQGAFVSDNLDSDSVRLQINEEIHSWTAGHLKKARGRSTAIWDYKSIDISNAGTKGDQLDTAFNEGTVQLWEVPCEGCKQFHVMRIKYEPDKPRLGGVKYDSSKAKLPGLFKYDYNKLRPTIEILMPCGYRVHNEDFRARRAMSLGGRYSEPNNKGAELLHRSYTYESVSVDFIDLMSIIKQKHDALRSRALGDPEPFRVYMQERECIPYDPESVPIINAVQLSVNLTKNRDGLPQPRGRFFSLDRQAGDRVKLGEFPYWWLVIRDFKVFYGVLRSVLVYEGRLETDAEVLNVLDLHECVRHHGCADSGDDTDYVYNFCMRNGINAIKGGTEHWYVHENGARRNYSPERPLHAMLSYPPKYDYVESVVVGNQIETVPDEREPLFWLYSKGGIRERLAWLRTNTQYETPGDVSEDYKNHNDAESRSIREHPRTREQIIEFVQNKRRNDLYVCECYCAMMLDMSGLIGEANIVDVKTENLTK